MASRRPLLSLALLILAIGITLRLWRLAADPLWLDEAYSAYAAAKGWRFLWQVVPTYETHPPFYYSLLRLWTLAFGDGLAALRALGAAAAIVTLPVVAIAGGLAARAAGLAVPDRRLTMLAALALAALSYPLFAMAREVRPYPILILAYAGALAAILRLQARTAAGEPLAGAAYAAYLALLAITLWLHNLGILYAAALGLALALAVLRARLARRDWLWLAGGHLLVLLVWLPALLILADQAPTWVRSTWLRFSPAALPGRLIMLWAAPGLAGLAATLALVALAFAGARAERARTAALLLVAAVLPAALAIGISLAVAPVFISRVMTATAVPALLLAALGVGAAGRWRLPALGAAAVMLAASAGLDLDGLRAPPKQDWRGMARWLAPRLGPGDRVYAYPNEGALPLAYALRDAGVTVPVRPVPIAVPAIGQGGWYPTGSRGVVSLPRTRLRAVAEDAASRATPTIWLLRLGANAYDVGDVFLEELLVDRRMTARWLKDPIDLIGLTRSPLPLAGGVGGGQTVIPTQRPTRPSSPPPTPPASGRGEATGPAAPAAAAAAR